jgi:hypothetical protein
VTADFFLLHCKNAGASGDLYENKGKGKQVSRFRCQVPEKAWPRCRGAMANSKFKIRTCCDTLYDGISPEVPENIEADV